MPVNPTNPHETSNPSDPAARPRVTRRRFLVALGVVAGFLGSGWAWDRRRDLEHWAVGTPLEKTPTGALDERTMRSLLSVTTALLDDRIGLDHYRDFFDWRARNLPGHRTLYVSFADYLDREARRAGVSGFVGASRERKREILAPMRPLHGLKQMSRVMLAPMRARYANHIVREVLRVFAGTDAWILSGYDTWPGQARGLEKYTQPPGAA
jgi:hypothetical protein